MGRYGLLLTDAQWKKIRPLPPKTSLRPYGGHPQATDREVLEGILWILLNGVWWQDLLEELSSPSTCWRLLKDWEEQGVWLAVWRRFLA